MPEETEVNQDNAASTETPANDLEVLRTELQTYKQSATTLASEKQALERRLQERDAEFRREFGRQGQQLGERIKTLEATLTSALQPKADQPKKRNRFDENLTVPDPIGDQDGFKKFQTGLVEAMYELREQNEKLASGGQNQDRIKALEDQIEAMKYQAFLDKEEQKLKMEYGLDAHDLARVHDYMKQSGIYAPKAAAFEIDDLEEKMIAYRQRRNQPSEPEEQPRREERKPKPKFDPVAAGREMLNTKSDRVPHGGSKNPADSELHWLEEGKAAVNNGEFKSWPEAKQKEYERKLMQALTANQNGASY